MIGILCALKCEADSLIHHFSLKPYPHKTPFSIYCSNNIVLIISGIGKTRAAAATAYLHAVCGCKGWLNIGIGGGRDPAVGKAFFAHQVCDLESGRAYYPTFGWKLREKTAAVITVDRVETRFEQDGIYDMEAAGFCSAAFCFSSAELIHCFKIVSDNKKSLPACNPQLIRELIAQHLGQIDGIIQKLTALVKDLSDPYICLDDFLDRWRLSQTQQHQLKRLLQRWEACYPDKNIWDTSIKMCRSGKEMIQYVSTNLY